MPNFKPPLSFEELKAIQERNMENADVRRLLWEIRRYHSVTGRLLQVHRSNYRIPQILQEAIWDEIKDDPSVIATLELDKPPPVHPDDEDDISGGF